MHEDWRIWIHWRTNNVGVFENTEKLSKIRLRLKDNACFAAFRGLYRIPNNFLYNYWKYIYFSASNLFNRCKIAHPHPRCLWSARKYLLIRRWRKRIENSLVWGQYSTCHGHQKFRKKMHTQRCWQMTPGIFSTTLSLNFQRTKSTQGSIFNVEKWTPGQFSTRFKILHYTGEWLQNLGLCLALRAFEQGGIFIVPYLLWHRTSGFPVSSDGPPHIVASYGTRADVEELF
jgi:hypothetical protein